MSYLEDVSYTLNKTGHLITTALIELMSCTLCRELQVKKWPQVSQLVRVWKGKGETEYIAELKVSLWTVLTPAPTIVTSSSSIFFSQLWLFLIKIHLRIVKMLSTVVALPAFCMFPAEHVLHLPSLALPLGWLYYAYTSCWCLAETLPVGGSHSSPPVFYDTLQLLTPVYLPYLQKFYKNKYELWKQ